MKVIIHNNKYDDEIIYHIEEFNEQERQEILNDIHSRGWEDKDCWSEILY